MIAGGVYYISNMKLAYWSILKYGKIKELCKNGARTGNYFSQEDATRNWKDSEGFDKQISPVN